MIKIKSLYDTVVNDKGLPVSHDQLEVFAEEGHTVTHRGADNDDFLMRYKARLIISDFAGNPSELVYVVLQWLKEFEPEEEELALDFMVDVLSHDSMDIMLIIPLTEIIKKTMVDGGIKLETYIPPRLDIVEDGKVELDIRHVPGGKEIDHGSFFS